ncbi:MAG: caspase family protein [Treponemataceae bacterium]|nr:caspase family protein [Treponemataceae bacterium]
MKKTLNNIVSKKIAFVLLTVAALTVFPLNVFAQSGAVERYALYIASNAGGEGRETLRYAGSDAEKLASTMIEVGGVKKQNSFVLIDSSKEEIDGALENISSIIEHSKSRARRTEFLFYYSGHSDENALLMGEESYNYSELKHAISAVPSDVHVVMLDSCFSGNFIRAKGGTFQPSFLTDDSTVVQGHAYLSSSSESESSQESDSIGASFFTHSVVNGLRGAADISGDNKVSLNELYYYAFNDTLSQTETSAVGPQHPSYNITLVGSGDLILSDLTQADSMLIFPPEANGRFFVRTIEGKLEAEINKAYGNQMSLALPCGYYSVTVVGNDSTSQTLVRLDKGTTQVLNLVNLRQVPLTATTARGSSYSDASASNNQNAVQNANNNPVQTVENNPKISVEPNINVNIDIGRTFSDGTSISAGKRIDYRTGETQDVVRISADNPFFDVDVEMINEADMIQLGEEMGFENVHFTPLIVSPFPGLYFPGGDSAFLSVSDFMATQENILGIQASSWMNTVRNRLVGIQVSSFMNILQGTGAGAQATGFMNIAKGHFDGIQGCGFMNIASDTTKVMRGIQACGFMNIASAGIAGAQVSGFMNISGNNASGAGGFQGTGFMNIAGNFDGVQLGTINIGKNVRGAQIGIVNIAKSVSGPTLGLVNIIEDGIKNFSIFWDGDDTFFQYQGGTEYFFTTFMVGNKDGFDSDNVVFGAGFGFRFGWNLLNFDVEFLGKTLVDPTVVNNNYDFGEQIVPSLRLSANLWAAKHFGVFCAVNADFANMNSTNRYKDYWKESDNCVKIDLGNDPWKMRISTSFGINF